MTNNEIVQHYINNRLIKTCVEVQGRRAHIANTHRMTYSKMLF